MGAEQATETKSAGKTRACHAMKRIAAVASCITRRGARGLDSRERGRAGRYAEARWHTLLTIKSWRSKALHPPSAHWLVPSRLRTVSVLGFPHVHLRSRNREHGSPSTF